MNRGRSAIAMLCVLGSMHAADADQWEESIRTAERLHAERRLSEARRVLTTALTQVSSHTDREFRLAQTLNNLASIAQDQGRFFEAEDFYQRSIAHWEAAGEGGHREFARTLNNLSSLLYGAGKYKEAEALLDRAQAIGARARDADPDFPILVNSGLLYVRLGKFRRAEENYLRAWAILAPQRDSRKLEFARLAHYLGVLRHVTGQKEEANAYFAIARGVWKKLIESDASSIEALMGLAAVSASAGQTLRAQELMKKALAVAERDLPPGHPWKAEVLAYYAQLLRDGNQKTEAASLERRAAASRSASEESLARHTIGLEELSREKRSK